MFSEKIGMIVMETEILGIFNEERYIWLWLFKSKLKEP